MSYAKLEYKVPNNWFIDKDGRNAYFFEGTEGSKKYVIKISDVQSMEISKPVLYKIIRFILGCSTFIAFILIFLVSEKYRINVMLYLGIISVIVMILDNMNASLIIYLVAKNINLITLTLMLLSGFIALCGK